MENPKWGSDTKLDEYTWNDMKDTLEAVSRKYNCDDTKQKTRY